MSLPEFGIGSEYQDVRLLWWCRGPESNWLRPPFQGGALPVSYPGTLESVNFRGGCKLCQIAGPHQFCAYIVPQAPDRSRRGLSLPPLLRSRTYPFSRNLTRSRTLDHDAKRRNPRNPNRLPHSSSLRRDLRCPRSQIANSLSHRAGRRRLASQLHSRHSQNLVES